MGLEARRQRCVPTIAGLICALALTLGACSKPAPPLEGPKLEVEYFGCSRADPRLPGVAADPPCLRLQGRSFRLWAASSALADLEVQVGERVLTPTQGEAVQGGFLFTLRDLDGNLPVEVRATEEGAVSTWRLPLATDPWFTQLGEEIRPLVGDQQHDAAILNLEHRLATARTARERGLLLSTIARIEFTRGQPRKALEFFRRAVQEDRQGGERSAEIQNMTMLIRVLAYELEDVGAALEILADLPEPPPADGGSRYLIAFYRGSLALRMREDRNALRHLRDAVRQAERLGLENFRIQAEELLAVQLRLVGLAQEAGEILVRLEQEVDLLHQECEQGKLLLNIGWERLLAREAGHTTKDPRQPLGRAQPLLQTCTTHDDVQTSLLLDQALAEIQDGAPAEARRYLEQIPLPTHRPSLLLWWREIEARIALAEHRPAQALELYQHLEQMARDVADPGALWRATFGQGRALAAAGHHEAARQALEAAEDLLDGTSYRVPIDAGRETSAAVYAVGTRFYLQFLVQQNRPAEALAVARRSLARTFRSLEVESRLAALTPEEKGRWVGTQNRHGALRRAFDEAATRWWQIPQERQAQADAQQANRQRELRQILDQAMVILDQKPVARTAAFKPPKAREVLLIYHPLPSGWVGLAADGDGIQMQLLPNLHDPWNEPPEDLARQALAPFRELIERAEQVRILPYGGLWEVDFHTLPFADDILLAQCPVVYGLDLPRLATSPTSPTSPSSTHRALLVEDPSNSLRGVPRGEIPTVLQALRSPSSPWEIHLLAGHQATTAAFKTWLTKVDLLHFAGHADFLAHAQGSLELAAGSRLTVGEILTLGPMPGSAVLSACEGARTDALETPAALGLAQAFLIAGSSQVVASTRTVEDRVTATLMEHFYTAWVEGASMAEALRQAQLTLQQGQAVEWASFRVVER